MEAINRITIETLKSSFVYDDFLKRVFDAFTKPEIYNKIISEFADEIRVISGTSYAEIGTKVSIAWKGCATMTLEVINVETSKNIKKIIFRVINNDEMMKGLNYHLSSTFIWDSKNYKTTVISEIIFDKPMLMSEEEVKMSEKKKLKIFNKVRDYLKLHTDGLFNEESIIINVSPEKLWETIIDWNNIKLHVPEVAESAVYDGPIEKGTVVHIYHNTKQIEYHLRIKSMIIETDSREYILDFFAGKPVSPKQELIFKIVNIDNQCSLLQFRHNFKEYVTSKMIKHISKEKLSIMEQLKKSLEKDLDIK